MKLRSTLFFCLAALITASCGSNSAPATPTSSSTPTTTTPAVPAASTPLTLVSPASDDQLGTLRPTVTVTNPASTVYPFVTTVQGNRFRFRGGDPALMKESLQRLFQQHFHGSLQTFLESGPGNGRVRTYLRVSTCRP